MFLGRGGDGQGPAWGGGPSTTTAPTVENAKTNSEIKAMFRGDDEGTLREARSSVSPIASTVNTHRPQVDQAAILPLICVTPPRAQATLSYALALTTPRREPAASSPSLPPLGPRSRCPVPSRLAIGR